MYKKIEGGISGKNKYLFARNPLFFKNIVFSKLQKNVKKLLTNLFFNVIMCCVRSIMVFFVGVYFV